MIETIVMIASGVFIVVGLVGGFLWLRNRQKPLKQDYFREKWKELQKLLRNKNRWDVALIEADNLLDIALKKKHIRGHNMGERLVKAQRLFTDNDGVWFAHKLRNKIQSDPELKLKETEIKQALLAVRQALKDVGALPR